MIVTIITEYARHCFLWQLVQIVTIQWSDLILSEAKISNQLSTNLTCYVVVRASTLVIIKGF